MKLLAVLVFSFAIWVLSNQLVHKEISRNPTTIILHATAGLERVSWKATGAIKTLKERELSYNYIITKSGLVIECVNPKFVSFNAGSSYGPREEEEGISKKQEFGYRFEAGTSVNDYTISIAFVNLNDGKDPYTKDQLNSFEDLTKYLRKSFPSLRWITTHYYVSPHRKTDPKDFPIFHEANKVGLRVWFPSLILK